jgi:outer membrane protein TolC
MMDNRTIRRATPLTCIAAAMTLSGCATVKVDEAMTDVNALIEDRTRHTVALQQTDAQKAEAADYARQLLARPLTADRAVQIAFLKNPAIQASLADIGIAQADVAQAGRMKNPIISLGRVAGDGVLEIERQFLFSVLSLFTIGPRTAIARDRAEHARFMTALSVVSKADNVRRAWVEAVAARERIAIMQRMYTSVQASENLGQRMAQAGSMTALDQAKLKVAKAEAAAQLAKAKLTARMAREKLIREMGVWGPDTKFKLPSRLPTLPGKPRMVRNAERLALLERLDIRAAKRELEALQKTIGLTQFTGLVSLLEISGIANYEREREDGGDIKRTHITGVEVEFAIPIFDPGDAKVSRAKFVYMRAFEELRSLAITARSEVREAYDGYRGAYDLANHYRRTIVPLNKRITDEELLRYNGMLASVHDVLNATTRHQAARLTALEAQRDFWLADSQLDFVLVVGGGKGISMQAEVADAGGADEEH